MTENVFQNLLGRGREEEGREGGERVRGRRKGERERGGRKRGRQIYNV